MLGRSLSESIFFAGGNWAGRWVCGALPAFFCTCCEGCRVCGAACVWLSVRWCWKPGVPFLVSGQKEGGRLWGDGAVACWPKMGNTAMAFLICCRS